MVRNVCISADTARFTPAYAKIGVSPDGGSTVGMVGTVGVRRALQIFLAEDSLRSRPMNGAWSPKSFRWRN